MNRIQEDPVKSSAVQRPEPPTIESALFAPPSHDTTWALFTPLHYEANYGYPLLVWLHGQGANDERQLLRIMPMISLRNYVGVAPRGFLDDQSPGSGHYRWPQTPDHVGEAEHRVFESILAAQAKCHVSPRRVFLAGFGEGGTMAFRIAMNHPDRFAGVLSLDGPFPAGNNPFGNLTTARKLPVFLTVGRDSTEYSPEKACDDLRLFHSAGMSVSLRQYPCGQQLSPQMLRDLDRWIIEQITSPDCRPESSGPQF